MTQSWHSACSRVIEVFIFKKSNFGQFLDEKWFKMLLLDLKMSLNMFHILVLFSSSQTSVQNLKSIHYCRNQKNFCKTCKNRKNHRNSMDAVHSQGHSCQTDGPMRVLGLVFLLQGNPNAPQQVNFSIQILAHNTQHSIWETTVLCVDETVVKCNYSGL